MVSGHLRRLALLTMLNYPAVKLDSGLSEEQWLDKQKEVVHPTSWVEMKKLHFWLLV